MNTEQLRAELLPCPFCGESKNLTVQHCEGTVIHPSHRIYCDNCGGSNGYTDRGDHVENWNRLAALQHSCRETSQDREAVVPYEVVVNVANKLLGAEQYERFMGEIDHAMSVEGGKQ